MALLLTLLLAFLFPRLPPVGQYLALRLAYSADVPLLWDGDGQEMIGRLKMGCAEWHAACLHSGGMLRPTRAERQQQTAAEMDGYYRAWLVLTKEKNK